MKIECKDCEYSCGCIETCKLKSSECYQNKKGAKMTTSEIEEIIKEEGSCRILKSEYEEIRADEQEKFIWCLEHFDYHMSREELIQKVKEIFAKN